MQLKRLIALRARQHLQMLFSVAPRFGVALVMIHCAVNMRHGYALFILAIDMRCRTLIRGTCRNASRAAARAAAHADYIAHKCARFGNAFAPSHETCRLCIINGERPAGRLTHPSHKAQNRGQPAACISCPTSLYEYDLSKGRALPVRCCPTIGALCGKASCGLKSVQRCAAARP